MARGALWVCMSRMERERGFESISRRINQPGRFGGVQQDEGGCDYMAEFAQMALAALEFEREGMGEMMGEVVNEMGGFCEKE